MTRAQRKTGSQRGAMLAMIGAAALVASAGAVAAAKAPAKHAAKPVAKTAAKAPAKPTLPDPSTAAPAAKPIADDGIPRAKPIGNPADWFPADAYPPEARNAGQEGRTAFSVKVDAQGRLLECDIVQSSGSAQLDNTTCDLIVTHGRFTPAHDATGHPVAGVWRSAMRWQLVTGPSALDSE